MRAWKQCGAAVALCATLGAANAQLLIGQTAGFSGQVAAGVKETSDGAKLYLDSVNAKGGVNGQKIEMVALDDKFDPKLAKADAQAVLIIASGSAVVDANNAIRAAGSAAQIVTLSNNASAGFIKSLGANARGVIVTQVYPNERAVTYPMVKEAQELARAKGLGDISPAMLEGYAAAKVLVEGLKRAGPKPTREKVQVALESLRKFDLGGLEITYGPDDHTGLDFADLSIIGTDGKFRR